LKGRGFSRAEAPQIACGFTECWETGFVSGHRFSDAADPLKSDAPSGAGHWNSISSANCLPAEDCRQVAPRV